MVSLRRFLPAVSSPPTVYRRSTVTKLAASNPPAPANLAAIGLPGIYQAGGYVYFPWEHESAWRDQFNRDETIRRMQTDTVIGYVLMMMKLAIRRVDWRVEPVDDSEEAKAVAEFVQDALDKMDGLWPGDTMSQILTFLAWGWSAMEPVYLRRPDGKIGWRRWQLIPQSSRLRWEFDAADNVTALVQTNYANQSRDREIVIPIERLIVFRFTADDNNPEGSTPLRAAFDAWYFCRQFQQLEGILFERFGGLPIGRISSADIRANSPAYREMQNIITSVKLNEQAGLVLSSDRDDKGNYVQDFDLKSPAAGATVPTADPIIRRYQQEKVTAFLANIARTGQDNTGSFALADVHSGMFQRSLTAHLDTIANEINSQELPRFMALNGIPETLWPTIKHGNVEEEDLAALANYVKTLNDAQVLEHSPELSVALLTKADLPVATVEELQAKADAEAKAAEKARQDALTAQRAQQTANQVAQSNTDQNAPAGTTDAQTGNPATMTEVRKLVEADGKLTLSDALAIVKWWDGAFPDQAGLLNAEIVTGG